MTDGGLLYLERGVCQVVRDGLAARGHTLRSGGDYGGYQAILRDSLPDGSFTYRAASEMRKDGQAVGY
jgi:gamma-glutamyltranspeptidase / glutathione hydrolase